MSKKKNDNEEIGGLLVITAILGIVAYFTYNSVTIGILAFMIPTMTFLIMHDTISKPRGNSNHVRYFNFLNISFATGLAAILYPINGYDDSELIFLFDLLDLFNFVIILACLLITLIGSLLIVYEFDLPSTSYFVAFMYITPIGSIYNYHNENYTTPSWSTFLLSISFFFALMEVVMAIEQPKARLREGKPESPKRRRINRIGKQIEKKSVFTQIVMALSFLIIAIILVLGMLALLIFLFFSVIIAIIVFIEDLWGGQEVWIVIVWIHDGLYWLFVLFSPFIDWVGNIFEGLFDKNTTFNIYNWYKFSVIGFIIGVLIDFSRITFGTIKGTFIDETVKLTDLPEDIQEKMNAKPKLESVRGDNTEE